METISDRWRQRQTGEIETELNLFSFAQPKLLEQTNFFFLSNQGCPTRGSLFTRNILRNVYVLHVSHQCSSLENQPSSMSSVSSTLNLSVRLDQRVPEETSQNASGRRYLPGQCVEGAATGLTGVFRWRRRRLGGEGRVGVGLMSSVHSV